MTPAAGGSPHSVRMQALERANEVRKARAELKRRVGAGELSAAHIILAPPREASSWPLGDLLVSQPQWGHAKCRRFLADNQIDGLKPIGRLTGRQRRLLAAQLALDASRHDDAPETARIQAG
jgi:hypothetical protein